MVAAGSRAWGQAAPGGARAALGSSLGAGRLGSDLPFFPSMKDEQRQPVEPPIAEDDESMHLAESDSSDSDEDNNDYEIEHDPGLRIPIFSIMNFVKNKV